MALLSRFRVRGGRLVALAATTALVAIPAASIAAPAIDTTTVCGNEGVPVIARAYDASDEKRENAQEFAACYKSGAIISPGDPAVVEPAQGTSLQASDLFFMKAYVEAGTEKVAIESLTRSAGEGIVGFAGQNDAARTYFNVATENSPVYMEFLKRDTMLEVTVDTSQDFIKGVVYNPGFTAIKDGKGSFSIVVDTDRSYTITPKPTIDAVVEKVEARRVETSDESRVTMYVFNVSGITDQKSVTIKFEGTKKDNVSVEFNKEWRDSAVLKGTSESKGLKSWELYEKANNKGVSFEYLTESPYNSAFRDPGVRTATMKYPPRGGYVGGTANNNYYANPVGGTAEDPRNMWDGDYITLYDTFWGFGSDRPNDLGIPQVSADLWLDKMNHDSATGHYGGSLNPVVRNNAFQNGNAGGGFEQVSNSRELAGVYVDGFFIPAPRAAYDWTLVFPEGSLRDIKNYVDYWNYYGKYLQSLNNMFNDGKKAGDTAVFSDNPTSSYTFQGGAHDGLKVDIILTDFDPVINLNSPYWDSATGQGQQADTYVYNYWMEDVADKFVPGPSFFYTYNIKLSNVKEDLDIRPVWVTPEKARIFFATGAGIDHFGFIAPKTFDGVYNANEETKVPLAGLDDIEGWLTNNCDRTDKGQPSYRDPQCAERMHFTVELKNGYTDPKINLTRAYYNSVAKKDVLNADNTGSADKDNFQLNTEAVYSDSFAPANAGAKGHKYLDLMLPVPNYNRYMAKDVEKVLPYSDRDILTGAAKLLTIPVSLDLAEGKFTDATVLSAFNEANTNHNVAARAYVTLPADYPAKKDVMFTGYKLVGVKDGKETDITAKEQAYNAAEPIKDRYYPGESFNIRSVQLTEGNGDINFDSLKFVATYADAGSAGAGASTYKVEIQYKDAGQVVKTEYVSMIGAPGLHQSISGIPAVGDKKTLENKNYKVTSSTYMDGSVLTNETTIGTVVYESYEDTVVTFKVDDVAHVTGADNEVLKEVTLADGATTIADADVPAVTPAEGYKVLGWFEDGATPETALDKAAVVGKTFDASATFVAKTKAAHTVTFAEPSKDVCTNLAYTLPTGLAANYTVLDGSTLTAPGAVMDANGTIADLTKLESLAEPSDENCTFTGWKVTAGNATPSTVATSQELLAHVFSANAPESFTVTPEFAAIPVKVTFKTDNQEATLSTTETTVNKGLQLTEFPTLTSNDFTIIKWYKEGDTEKTAIDTTQPITITEPVTYVAEVKAIHTITLKIKDPTLVTFKDGSTTAITLKVVDGKTIAKAQDSTITAAGIDPVLTEEGKKSHELDGWYVASGPAGRAWGGMTTEDLFNTVPHANMTYEFRTKLVTFDVIFLDSDQATELANAAVARDEVITSKIDVSALVVADGAVKCLSNKTLAADSPDCKAWGKEVFNGKWVNTVDATQILDPAAVGNLKVTEDLKFRPQMKVVFTDKDGKPLSGDDASSITLSVQVAYVVGAHASLTEYPSAYGKLGSKLSDLIAEIPAYTVEPGYELTGNWIVSWTVKENPADPDHSADVVKTEVVAEADLANYVVEHFLKIAPETRAKVFNVSFTTNNKEVGLKDGEPIKVTFNTEIGKEPTLDSVRYALDYWYVEGTDPSVDANKIATGSLKKRVLTETADTTFVAAVSLKPDMDGDGIPDDIDNDIDGDGVNNSDEEAAGLDPRNPDTNGDGVKDGDEDCDNDGVPNKDESDPTLPHITDKDGNGVADLIDPAYPDPSKKDSKPTDTDGDGTPDYADTDMDGDGVNNADEIAAGMDPKNPDTNGDGIKDGDEDCDGDGVPNKDESDPTLPHITDKDDNGIADLIDPAYPDPSKKDSKPTDTDGDGTPDYKDNDKDGDGVNNADENAAGLDPSNPDTNGDGVKDGDEDSDNDGVPNKDESDPDLPHITDKDDNGKADLIDPAYPNPDNKDKKPVDTDGDGIPDPADTDMDGDGVNNADEIAAGMDPKNPDTNGDGIKDGDEDCDGDGVPNKDESDPSLPHITDKDDNGIADLMDPAYPDPSKKDSKPTDTDGDGVPDYKDNDKDGDGVNNADENAAGLDPSKTDSDGNGVADGDEDSDGDGIPNKDESDPNLPHITDKDATVRPTSSIPTTRPLAVRRPTRVKARRI